MGGVLPDRGLMMHRDTFDLPPSARLLARSDRYPQAFEAGSVMAVQFHPEADVSTFQEWVAHGSDRMIVAAGRTVGDVIEEVRRSDRALRAGAVRLFEKWIDLWLRVP